MSDEDEAVASMLERAIRLAEFGEYAASERLFEKARIAELALAGVATVPVSEVYL